MAAINSMEAGLLTEFRKRFTKGELNEERSSDLYLIRWIRARNHNLNKAEEMLRKSLKWRIENDIDNISSWIPPPEIKELMALCLCIAGQDYDNCPVGINRYGKANFTKIAQSGQQDMYVKFCDSLYESAVSKMRGLKRKDGSPVTQFVLITDMKGFSYKCLTSKAVVDMLVAIVRSLESNQPETLKRMYIINASSFFSMILSIIKPFMSPDTKAKIFIFNQPSKWMPALREAIPEHVLPPAYGGTNTATAAELMLGSICSGSDSQDSETETGLLTIVISARDKIELVFEVEEKQSRVTWAFKTNKMEIHFGIKHDSEVHVDKKKTASHLKLIEGSITCKKAGEYIVIFDNGNNGEEQELQYRIDVRSPAGAKRLAID